MSSVIKEDAGPFTRIENDPERRRYSISKSSEERVDRRRKSSVRFEEQDSRKETEFIVSPEDIPDEYELPEDKSGLLVIFNHENFSLQEIRKGTMKDKNDLVDCLTRLRYEVRQEFIFKDLNKEEIETQLEKIQTMDHSKRSSLIVVFLTHGDSEGKLYPFDGSDKVFITCEEVWNYFSIEKCPSLKGKPKIFIFQACKGEGKSLVSSGIQEDSVRRIEAAKKNYTLPSEADVLIAYSTVEGNVAYRHPELGSWFIQELCRNFTAYGRRDDLVTIITRVSKCVAYHYQNDVYKQMPCFISTLTRKFYLCKSKERSYLLDLHDQNKLLLNKIESIQKQLEEMNPKDKDSKDKDTVKKTTKKTTTTTSKTSEKPRWR